jgi:tetratricopeptide (TPR) repeat protein
MKARTANSRAIIAGLFAALAVLPVFAQEEPINEPVIEPVIEPVKVRATSPLLYVDAPVLVPEGLDSVMIMGPAVSDSDPEADPSLELRLASIRQYKRSVSDIELRGGAWDGSLVEELSALGRLQQEQGDHEAAIVTLDRAIHVNRINSGLYTLEQVPEIEQLLQSHMALGNWEQADIYNNYLFLVQQKSYGSDDPRLIPVLDSLATWNVQAFNIGYGDLLGLRLQESMYMFAVAARMVGVHFGKSDERFVAYLKNVAISAHMLSSNQNLMMRVDRPEYRDLEQMRGAKTPSFKTGVSALTEIIRFYEEQGDDAYVLAEAITYLADWCLMFDRRRAALQNYTLAWQVLQEQENADELTERLFGRVVPLPSFSSSVEIPAAFYMNEDRTAALDFDYADLTFEVTGSGHARNVESITEETADNSLQLSGLRASVRASRFRPLLVDGELMQSNDNVFRYRYWY